MKKLLMILFIFIFSIPAFSSTYIRFWVNGVEADSAVQGDFFDWEYDLSAVGGTALVSIYYDQNSNQIIDAGDVNLVTFSQTDGVLGGDGPGDSSAVPDGIIYSTIGSFGFVPGDYIFYVEDPGDGSSVEGAVHLSELANPDYWATGVVTISGVTAPDPSLQNIMIMAEPANPELGFWTGITDENGNYTVNLPDSAANSLWRVSIFSESLTEGYLIEPDEYEEIEVQLGENADFDFLLTPLTTTVYGQVLDEDDNVVPVFDYGSLENVNSGRYHDFTIEDGEYLVYASFDPGDTEDVPFNLYISGESLIPNYLIPNTWSDSRYQFNLSENDNVERNFYVLSTDALIHVYITENSTTPSFVYRVEANIDSGRTNGQTDANGYIALHIRSPHEYWVSINEFDDDEPLLPPGYIIENGNGRNALPGDTVYFNLIPAQSLITGRLLFEPDEMPFVEINDFNISANSQTTGDNFNGQINQDSLKYTISVTNDTYDVYPNNWTGDFLAMPFMYSNITVSDDTIDGLDFAMNYTHANLQIKLINVPGEYVNSENYLTINTTGSFPYFYIVNAQVQPDSSFYFRVCEGEWYITPPFVGPDHSPTIMDTTITVIEGVTEYYLEITYSGPSAINTMPVIPKEFSVKQNYPNPFNPSTTFEFDLPEKNMVTLEVYSLTGEKVATVLDGQISAGTHRILWNAGHLPSGMYFYRLNTENQTVTKKLLLVK
ncbi:MAG: T9SS type A sorting domain-containing protein [Calditrichaceae bacterium]|nr:T9SS type A sorting domain-containing protein [Calditrichaceae bacterium]MBN2708443.1 T9SS type A sorting domain-containing protein [Calditrichaceae bacterium]RQV93057.1 MAG: T9SS C-terminal target domain-containing protein [Calditrichota bacterium]